MAGKKGQRAWNKGDVVDYRMLKRYSLRYLLILMRKQNPTEVEDKRQFKTALEVIAKDIGKQEPNQGPTINQFFFNQLLERAGIKTPDESRYSNIPRG